MTHPPSPPLPSTLDSHDQLSTPPIVYLALGGFIVCFGMISLLVKQRLYIGESILATAFGIIIGPYCANIIDPRTWATGVNANAVTLEILRITLATGLFAIGAQLPKAYLANHWRSLTIMLIPTMSFGWLMSAGFIYWLFPGLTYTSALCISACLTPTDPVLAVAITSGTYAMKHVPGNIRHLIASESAANDGLAYPFLSISIYLSIEASKQKAIGEWILIGWLYQVVFGVIIGTCFGYVFCHVMKFAKKHEFIDRESYVAQYVALTLMTVGLANMLGSDDLLAAFAAGSAIAWDGDFIAHTENEAFSAVIDLVLNCAAFIYIGAWLSFASYNIPELSISPERLLALFVWVPDINGWREAAFCGHFGPMGVSALFVSTLALTRLDDPRIPPRNQEERLAASLHPIVSFVVLGSIIIHGLSIPFLKLGQRTMSISTTWSRTGGGGGTASSNGPEWLTTTKSLNKSVSRTTEDVEATGEGPLARNETTIETALSGASVTAAPRGQPPRLAEGPLPPGLSAEVEVCPQTDPSQVGDDTMMADLSKDSTLQYKVSTVKFRE